MDDRARERRRLERIQRTYMDAELAGANEQYHLYLRDRMIPGEGGRSALELGCGKGLWTERLCDLYDEVDVVDGSRQLLDRVAQEHGGRAAKLTTHCALVEEFAAGRHWQHVYMTFLLEHLEDPVAVLGGLQRFMDGDSHLFIAVPNALSVHREAAVRMGLIETVDELSANDHKVGHRRVYTPDLLQEQVRAAGFRIDEVMYVGLKPVNLKQMKSWSEDMVWAFCASGDLCGEHAAYLGLRASL
jgi:2-polyprenyl-3-methyl-5-hydroxy-6-metoxy-1,4-benzoquinol methylase